MYISFSFGALPNFVQLDFRIIIGKIKYMSFPLLIFSHGRESLTVIEDEYT